MFYLLVITSHLSLFEESLHVLQCQFVDAAAEKCFKKVELNFGLTYTLVCTSYCLWNKSLAVKIRLINMCNQSLKTDLSCNYGKKIGQTETRRPIPSRHRNCGNDVK